MRAIICGDLHIGIKSDSNFINYQIKEFNKIIDYTLNSSVKNIIFLGDIFHTRQHIDIHILHKVLRCFERLEDLNVYLLAGNHDVYYKNNNSINSLSIIFKKYNFNIIDEYPKEIIIDDVRCFFVPWINKNNYTECLDHIKKSSAKYCFGHFAINNFHLVSGIKETNGLKQSLFKKFVKTFSGHFHLKDDQNNISFVGSFCSLDWNDYSDKKRIMKIDTVKGINKSVFLTDNIFEKLFVNDYKKIDITYYKNKILKIYIEKKLTPKGLSVIDNLKENALFSEIIDNTILLEKINENIKNEDFLLLLDEVLKEQDNIDDNYKKEVKKYLKKLYNQTLQGE